MLETSPTFRRWLCTQLRPDTTIESHLSVSRSVQTSAGESDIELAVETRDGDCILFLLENKIDATLQERQAERYHERGKRYTGRDLCDEYAVALFAPEEYVTDAHQNAFGTAITYEAIRNDLTYLTTTASPSSSLSLSRPGKIRPLGMPPAPR